MFRCRKALTRCSAVAGLLLLAACGGSDGTSAGAAPQVAAPPPPVLPPPPPPAAGGVRFTLDNSIAATGALSAAGGLLTLDVPGGASFTLNVPEGAFFEPSTDVTMQSIVDTQGLPAGLTPIAAVSLGPSGDFAVQPSIEIDLRSLPRPVGSVVVFLANDDGSGLTYLLPQGDDPVAAALGDGPYRARVPHFSGVGIAVSDPDGAGVPEVAPAETAEARARRLLNRLIEEQAREVLLGQRMSGGPLATAAAIVGAWSADLSVRADGLDENTTLSGVQMIAKETLRLEEEKRALALADFVPPLDESEIGMTVLRRLKGQLDVLNERCLAGNVEAEGRINARIAFLSDLAAAGLLDTDEVEALSSFGFCQATVDEPLTGEPQIL